MIRKAMQLAFVGILFFMLAGIGVCTWFFPTTKTFEKRKLAAKPELPVELLEWDSWPENVDAWLADSSYRRQDLVSQFNKIREKLGISPQRAVLVGKDGWLFLTSGEALDDYRNSRLYNAPELDRWHEYLMHRHLSAQLHGAVYYLVIPPNKHNIYPEYLPSHIQQLSSMSRLDQIIERMQGTGVRILDLRPVLLEAKQTRQAYHKGDSHWNLWGANYAQHALTELIKKDFPDLDSYRYPLDDFVDGDSMDLAAEDIHYYQALYFMMGVAAERSESQPLLRNLNRSCVKKADIDVGEWERLGKAILERSFFAEQCDTGKYRALLFRDSFAELLQPFLSTRFSYTAYLRIGRPVGLHFWDHFMQAVKPDIVVDEMISRHLRHVPQPGRDYPAVSSEISLPADANDYFEFD